MYTLSIRFLYFIFLMGWLSLVSAQSFSTYDEVERLSKRELSGVLDVIKSDPAGQLASKVLNQEQFSPLWNKAEGVATENGALVTVPVEGAPITLIFGVENSDVTRAALNRIFAGAVPLCHYPPGNPDNTHEIDVAFPAVEAHFAHGDTLGTCLTVEHAEGIEAAYIDLLSKVVVRYLLLPGGEGKVVDVALSAGTETLDQLSELSGPGPLSWPNESYEEFHDEYPMLVPPRPNPPPYREADTEAAGDVGIFKDVPCLPGECPHPDPDDPPPPGEEEPPEDDPTPPGEQEPPEDDCDEGHLDELLHARTVADGALTTAEAERNIYKGEMDQAYKEADQLWDDVDDLAGIIADYEENLGEIREDAEQVQDENSLGNVIKDCLHPISCYVREKQSGAGVQELIELAEEWDRVHDDYLFYQDEYDEKWEEWDRANRIYEGYESAWPVVDGAYRQALTDFNEAHGNYVDYKETYCLD